MINKQHELIEALYDLYEKEGNPYLSEDNLFISQKKGFGIKDSEILEFNNLQESIFSLDWNDFYIDLNFEEDWKRVIDDCYEKKFDDFYDGRRMKSDKYGYDEFEHCYNRFGELFDMDFPKSSSQGPPCAWYSTFHNVRDKKWGDSYKRRLYCWFRKEIL